MASSDTKFLEQMATKLGVGSEGALRKASEFVRLLQLRASTGTRQLSDTSRAIMCLDLACDSVGHPTDKADVLRLAGLNQKQYTNGINLIKNLLGLSTPVNVNTLCVQLGVSEMASFAQKVLNKYVELQSQGPNGRRPIDTSLPAYNCVAVFMACKHNKVKVDKSKLVEASRVKKIQFDKVAEDFKPVLEELKQSEVKKACSKRPHKLIAMMAEHDEENKETCSKEQKNADADEEDFEAWKKRILSEAGENS